MTAAAVAARRARDTLGTPVGSRGLLSLGFSDRRTDGNRRPHSADALLPNLDRTRTVGVVTLPGAFVVCCSARDRQRKPAQYRYSDRAVHIALTNMRSRHNTRADRVGQNHSRRPRAKLRLSGDCRCDADDQRLTERRRTSVQRGKAYSTVRYGRQLGSTRGHARSYDPERGVKTPRATQSHLQRRPLMD